MPDHLDAIDILAIHEQIARYSLLADDGDAAGLGALLERANLLINDRLLVSRDRARMVELFSGPTSGLPGRRHVTTNIIVEPTGATSATSRCYFVYTEALPGTAPRLLQTGQYRDTFEKAEGAWHFTERHILVDGQPAAT